MSADLFVSRVLSPVSVSDFFQSYWEKQPLHFERDEQSHFAQLLDLAEIERVLSTQDLRFPDCQLTQSGQHISPSEYCDSGDRVIPLRLMQRHDDGATLVLSRAHRRFEGLGRLVRDAIANLRWRCQANVYLSPRARQGFNPHYDTHDVFILQIAGAKCFRFYAGGVDLPLPSDRFDPSTNIDNEMVEEVVLNAGDSLYIPRGLAHDAVAQADESSLHVTLGVFPVTEFELVRQCLRLAAERSVELRRAIPRAQWLATNDVRSRNRSISDDSSLSMDTLMSFREEAMSQLRDDVFLEADGAVESVSGVKAFSDSSGATDGQTILTVSRSCLITERLGDRLKLRTHGQVLEFEGKMVAAVEALLVAGSMPVARLPGLDSEQQLNLSEQLLRERIVEIAEHP